MTSLVRHDLGDARILVVDDNVPSADLVQALLRRSGLTQVTTLNDSRRVLELCAELVPHLVVLDLHMPGTDGYDVLSELRRQRAAVDLPVLVLTADVTREATHRALTLGANDFLTKPIDATELLLRIGNLLNARAAHAGLRRRQRWLAAAAQLARDLLSDPRIEPRDRVCELARVAAGAVDAVIVDREAHETQDPDATSVELPLGPDAALVLTRAAGSPVFSATERGLARGFADQAEVAMELAASRLEREQARVSDDRHRIARDLHDHVIQRLFAAGLRLQQAGTEALPHDVVASHVDELDDIITEIRSTIVGLRHRLPGEPEQLGARLTTLAQQLTPLLGRAPSVEIRLGHVVVADEVADDLIAVAREAITNAARHAKADHVELRIATDRTDVVLTVADDGVGMAAGTQRRSGLDNLAARAARHGGSCTVSPGPSGGTILQWQAPAAGLS